MVVVGVSGGLRYPLVTVPHASIVFSMQLTRPLASREQGQLVWLGNAITGLRTRSFSYEGLPETRTAVALLSPLGAHHLLGVSSGELGERRLPAAQFLPGYALSVLADRLSAAWPNDPLQTFEAWLVERALRQPRAAPPQAARAFRAFELARTGVVPSVDALAESARVSRRQLDRDCVRWLGFTPKQLLRTHRLQRALGLLRAGAGLVHAAALAGFADQAHMTNVLTRTTGRSPRVWALAKQGALGAAYERASGGELVTF
jgi:AraC-like DNA-binding protein